jgi:hypothetical protein
MEATLRTRETDAPQPPASGHRRPSKRELAFLYFVPPLLMALSLGMYRAGIGLPIPLSLALWSSVCLISWWLSEAFSHLSSRVLRPWHPPLWLVLTLGYLMNLWISSLYNVPIVAALIEIGQVPRSPDLVAYFELERSLFDPNYLWMLLRAGAAGLVVWLTANLLFERLSGTDRFGTSVAMAGTSVSRAAQMPAHLAQAAPPAVAPRELVLPRFFSRLEKLHGLPPDELIAVEAEDHYVRVHSRRGKELIYYRFRDALEELRDWDGLHTHRSVWVRRSTVTGVEESGRSTWVVLDSGDRLPVSYANRALVRAAALEQRP